MAKIIETPEEFFDIVILFLFDMMKSKDYSQLKRKDIVKMLELFEKKGLKPVFMQHYMKLSNQRRVEYKRIKEVFFNPESSMQTVNIIAKKNKTIDETTVVTDVATKEDVIGTKKDTDFYRTKDFVRKTILLMKKMKYKNPHKIINDLQLDALITKVLKEE